MTSLMVWSVRSRTSGGEQGEDSHAAGLVDDHEPERIDVARRQLFRVEVGEEAVGGGDQSGR
jgi:hypothetical protein